MKKTIGNEQKFQCVNDNWAVTLPSGNYQLYLSADGITYSKYKDDITGDDTLVVTGCVPEMYFYISGLTGEVEVLL